MHKNTLKQDKTKCGGEKRAHPSDFQKEATSKIEKFGTGSQYEAEAGYKQTYGSVMIPLHMCAEGFIPAWPAGCCGIFGLLSSLLSTLVTYTALHCFPRLGGAEGHVLHNLTNSVHSSWATPYHPVQYGSRYPCINFFWSRHQLHGRIEYAGGNIERKEKSPETITTSTVEVSFSLSFWGPI